MLFSCLFTFCRRRSGWIFGRHHRKAGRQQSDGRDRVPADPPPYDIGPVSRPGSRKGTALASIAWAVQRVPALPPTACFFHLITVSWVIECTCVVMMVRH
ncbi:hypothetical protein BIV24_10825 [Streptomyces colonosanans]|uniref:Uncharacterized protein n=1 Tax=Streptomyces colonosanans TaxID=1428652 RepID=A0A1S2PLG0_9ACTN|nr:hypothetical protein BIV24_10825 [Streptomyces colonosanans]